MIRRLATFAVTGVGFVMFSCDGAPKNNDGPGSVQQRNIVAGPGEKTFDENYSLRVSLPMPEHEFLAMLQRLKLRYDVMSEPSGIIPRPWHFQGMDLSKIQRTYQIYGNVNRRQRVAEIYRAYVDERGQVTYIENTFAYYDTP